MKKQMFSVLAACLSFAVLFTSCGNTPLSDDTEKTILDNNYEVGMLLYSGEEVPYDAPLDVLLQSKTDVFQGVWNIQSGGVEISGTPRVTALGPEYASVIDLWDGKDSFLIRDDEGIEKNEPGVEFIPYDYQTESRLVRGDGYSAEITTGNVCILTVEDGTETDFRNIDKAIEHNGQRSHLDELGLLGSSFDGTCLTLVFRCMDNNDFTMSGLVFVKLNTVSREVDWSDFIEVPHEYAEGLFHTSSETAVTTNEKFYFSGGSTVAYLDLSSGKVFGLETVTNMLDGLFPSSQRASFDGRPLPAEPAGNNDDVVIGYLQYDDKEPAASNVVYFAIHDTSLAGVLCLSNVTGEDIITTYDHELKEMNSVNVNHLSLKSIPIAWESTSYNAY